MKLDLRPRCKRCRNLIFKNAIAQGNWKRHQPFCSYHCQEWANTEANFAHLARLRSTA